MIQIQLYAKITDLKPTEPNKLTYKGHFNDPDEAILLDNDMDCIKAFAADIKKNGFKYCSAIEKDGTIRDGNCRYHGGIAAGKEYTPINIDFMLGTDRSFYPKKEVK